jgi:acyl-coenzyme A synthetase/AMP-(fatty) acid ligase
MNFSEHIERVAAAPACRDNFLADGRLTCPYPALPGELEAIGRYLAGQGITDGDCLAVECVNSVPSALLLIHLLRQGMGFALLPPSEYADQASALKPPPRFCSHRVTVLPVMDKDGAPVSERPERYFKVEPRKWESAESLPDLETAGKLFIRTSGSMGAAKIVVHSQDKVLGNALNCVEKYRFTAEDRMAIPVPIFHMYGFGAEFLPALLVGGSMDLQENTNLLKYLDRERRFQPTIAFVTPNLCEMLIRGRKSPRPYKVMVTSGQRIKEELFRALDPLCGNRLVNQYGSTEMGAIAACDPDESLDVRATTIGRPMGGVQLRIDGQDAARVGDLYCRHPFGFEGYMDEEGRWLSRAAEWHRTGDSAKANTDDKVMVVGRADDSINRSGYLVLLPDIENALETLDTVGQAVVLATRSETIQGQRLIAFCVGKSGHTPTGSQIRAAGAKILPKYAVPDDVAVLDALPLLPSGKVDRQALAALAERQTSIASET